MMANFNRFPEIAGELHQLLSQVVRKTAFDIQATYVSTCAKDTGFMANSCYVVTSTDSTYGNAGTPPGDSYLLPPVETPPDDLTAYTAVGANYAVFVELGTRFMNAQPAFYPAVEAARATFEAVLSAIGDSLK